jgi:uncharacterized protein (DUF1810 family)
VSSADPYDLQRFIDAQCSTFDAALAELRDGAKRSHWMWFIFPQIAGLGSSPTAELYAIRSLGEARAFLDHPLLGARLRRCVELLLTWAATRGAADILGELDALKLRSSLTLFDAAAPENIFGRALDALFRGERDVRTLALLDSAR